MNVLISTEENLNTQISFLNKESNDDTPHRNQKQESQALHKVNSSSEVSDIPSIEEDEAKKKAALANLQASFTVKVKMADLEENAQQEVSNQAFKLSSSGDEIVKADTTINDLKF